MRSSLVWMLCVAIALIGWTSSNYSCLVQAAEEGVNPELATTLEVNYQETATTTVEPVIKGMPDVVYSTAQQNTLEPTNSATPDVNLAVDGSIVPELLDHPTWIF